MSLDVEQLVAQITAKVTADVLAALSAQPSIAEPDDVWPEWDELGGEPVERSAFENLADAAGAYLAEVAEDLRPEPRKSPLRARLLAGQIEDAPEADDNDDGPRVAGSERGQSVVPISTDTFSERGAGFDPTGNDAWLARRYQREVVAAKRATPLEDQIKAV